MYIATSAQDIITISRTSAPIINPQRHRRELENDLNDPTLETLYCGEVAYSICVRSTFLLWTRFDGNATWICITSAQSRSSCLVPFFPKHLFLYELCLGNPAPFWLSRWRIVVIIWAPLLDGTCPSLIALALALPSQYLPVAHISHGYRSY